MIIKFSFLDKYEFIKGSYQYVKLYLSQSRDIVITNVFYDEKVKLR